MRKYLIWLVVFAAIEIGLSLYLTTWREHFWNSVSQKQSLQFIQQLGVFTVVALGACFVSGISGYLVNLASIEWRKKLNEKALTIRNLRIENMRQRVQQDCLDMPDLYLNLVFGTLKALMYIIVFSWSLATSFASWYLLVLIGYTVAGSFITRYIARPLIHLNYEQQRLEATYRQNLTINNFQECIRLMLGLAKKQKHLTYTQQFYTQVGVVLPLIIVAPVYFGSGMSLGNLMRFNSVGATILDNLSFGITSFVQINKLISCRRRLREGGII